MNRCRTLYGGAVGTCEELQSLQLFLENASETLLLGPDAPRDFGDTANEPVGSLMAMVEQEENDELAATEELNAASWMLVDTTIIITI